MAKISECFNVNFICLKVFGILWPGKNNTKFYKYYSGFYLFLTLIVYNILLTLNVFYTPRKIELFIREVVFYFAEASATVKAVMIFLKRKSLVEAFRILDCEAFKGEDEVGRQIVSEYIAKYKIFWKVNAMLSLTAYFSKVFVPIFSHVLFNTEMELPFYTYYFLDKETIYGYFVPLWFYQCIGIFGHMMYNVNMDSLIAGLMLKAIAQVRVVDHEIRSLKSKNEDDNNAKLNRCLRHYDTLLQFIVVVQNITSITMFMQFSVASGSICTILCTLLLPNSVGALVSMLLYMLMYSMAMILQIFVPAYLGTQLSYRSKELVSAAYSCDWIPRSESFKRSLKLFMLRANTPILLTGCGLFPLTLDTFTSIMKTAYSFFTLVRSIQDRE